MFKLYRRANAVVSVMQEGTVKSLWKSRTFWVNLLGALFELGQLVAQEHLVPPGVMAIALGAINIPLRLMTTQPVSLTGGAR
ncbi:MAG: hypothetical protein VW405_01055 [Rhodospirillaceae bacterium]